MPPMHKLELKKIRSLIAKDKISQAIKELLILSAEISGEMYNDVIALSARFENWDRRERVIGEANIGERGRIIDSLLRIVRLAEENLTQQVKNAEKASKNGDYYHALAIIEKVLILLEDEELREYKVKLSSNILAKSPTQHTSEDKFSFFWIFIGVVALASIFPAYILKQDPNEFDPYFFTNLILQIALLFCMVLYKIKPTIEVNKFIESADDFVRSKFENRTDFLKWFAERANESIKQFGVWWRYLGISFLSLYLFYYFYEIYEWYSVEALDKSIDDFVDVLVNGSEAFFLFVLYRILTDNTIKASPNNQEVFTQNLNIHKELGISAVIGVGFIIGYIFLKDTDHFGVFSLISRTLSGTCVAVGICLVIGRLDSKFIEPQKWELWILYTYAAIQLLFTLFDPTLSETALGKSVNIDETTQIAINEYFDRIKVVVLYFILFLKAFFIYFVIKIHRKNELFFYLLLGSKLNDEIADGKLKNPIVYTK